jgi:hypothetical protein
MHGSDLDEEHNRWGLMPSEFELVTTKNVAKRLTFAVLLTFFHGAGRFPHSSTETESGAVASLSRQLGLDLALDVDEGLNRTTKRHRAEVRTFCSEHMNPYGRYELDMSERIAL